MAEVFLCATGQLANTGKRDLRKAGIVVIEVDDPSQCQFIRSTETLGPDDMLWAAFDALRVNSGTYGRDQRDRLAANLAVIATEARARRKASDG